MTYRTFNEHCSAADFRFAIIVARFNPEITDGLLNGAKEALINAGAGEGSMSIYYAPGSFELPFMAQQVAATGSFDAIICLGAVLKGETPHFDYVAAAAQQGILEVSLKYNLPVMFGVITALTMEQAIVRSSDGSTNRGAEAALACLEVLATIKEMKQR